MRVRNNPNAEKYLITSNYLITEFPYKLNKDTKIELGMGKGEMLCHLALKNQSTEYIGIEKDLTIAAKAAKLFFEHKVKNIKIICDDIKKLNELLKGKVNLIYLTFSDPWPKKRHYKRRLTASAFLNLYQEILNKKGKLVFKTDNDDLFNFSLESLRENKWKILFSTNDLHNSERNKDNIRTGYEIKWSSKGKNINYLEAIYES